MATNVPRVPLLRALTRRNYAAAAASPKAASCGTSEVQVTNLPNKLVVASSDCGTNGLVKVSVAIRAGSRYESSDNFGVSHVMRNAAGLTTSNATQFGLMRNLQQMGAALSATSDREILTYTLETTCDKVEEGLKYLKYVTANQVYKPWELSDNIPRIKLEIETLPDKAKLLNYLHMAAYRTGLGNSVFARDYNIKKLGPETVQHFICNTFLTNRTSVAGVGIDHGSLVEFAQRLGLESGPGIETPASKFHSGELRRETNSQLTHCVIAAEASGLSKKEVFAYAVLSYALGGSPSIKWGTGVDPLSRAVSNIHSPVAAQAMNIVHSDSGLFAVMVSSSPDNTGYAVQATMKAMKDGLTDADISRGKAQLKAAVLFNGESCDGLLSDLSTQSALLGTAKPPHQLAASIDSVTNAQVKEALQKMVHGKKAMACIGQLYNTPYLDEL